MKRLLKFISDFSIIGLIGAHPTIAAATMLLTGIGGLVASGSLTTPTLTPQVSSNFGGVSNILNLTTNTLSPNGGTAGATQFPSTPTNSFGVYAELGMSSSAVYSQAFTDPFTGMVLSNNTTPGAPQVNFETGRLAGIPGTEWWMGYGWQFAQNLGVTAGSSYANGFYPITFSGSGCAQDPTGVWFGGNSQIQQVSPGLLCPPSASAEPFNATFIAANVPGSGAQQATNAGSVATTCSVVGSQAQVTAHVAVAHGLTPGLTYTMQGFTPSGAPPSGYNATYTALPGTTGTTLVGTNGASTCPGAVSVEGTALGGTGASFTLQSQNANPLIAGQTGITTHNNQKICMFLGEDGDDSNFPGAQYMMMVDEKGNSLPGSPTLIPYPNQGLAVFTGSTSNGSALLTVTAMNPFVITAGSYSGTTGYVTFTTSTAPGFVAGSEFTVSGMNSSGASVNLTYIAVNPSALSISAQQASTTIVGNPLSGPGGTPLAIASPGTITTGSTPQMVSVILPGMTILGSTGPAYVMPYGTSSSTGTGGTGTYALLSSQTASLSSGTQYGYYAKYVSAASGGVLTARSSATLGDFLPVFGGPGTGLPASQGWEGLLGNISMLYGSGLSQSNGLPSNTDLVNLCKKQTDIQSYATSKSLTVHSLYRMNDPGLWGDSSVADLTGSIAGTALTVGSTQYGSLPTVTGGVPSITISGAGVTGCPASCPTISSGSGSSYVLSASGGTVASEPMKAGTFKPANPAAANNVQGWIDTTAGVSTLHVTSMTSGTGLATFTGTLGTGFTVSGIVANTPISGESTMTVTGVPLGAGAINYAQLGAGMTVTGPAVTDSPHVLYQATQSGGFGPGQGGTYVLDKAETVSSTAQFFGSGILPGPPDVLQTTTGTGTIASGMYVTDGNHSLTGPPLLIVQGCGTNCWIVAGNFYPAITADTNMVGTFTTMVPGEYIQNSAAPTPITIPTKILTYSGACTQTGAYNGGPGCYTLSAVPNASGNVGASGSLQSFTGTTITDAGAIAPGPALTIADLGPGTVYPVNHSTNTATVVISGTYDVSTLGGTPTAIQSQVSLTANGPPIPGCLPCVWTNLSTAVVSVGTWSGQILNVPSSFNTPLYVTVRPANGTAYATMREPIRIGDVYVLWGQGQAGGVFNNQLTFNPFFAGLEGLDHQRSGFTVNEMEGMYGPEILPGYVIGAPVDSEGNRFWAGGGGTPFTEGSLTFTQTLSTAYGGLPVSNMDAVHDGLGIIFLAGLGNTVQTQSVATADGTKLSWCSTTTYCANAGLGGALTFNAAGLTGASIIGSIAAPGGVPTLTVNSWVSGALEPGMTLSPGLGVSGFTGTPTIVSCATNCTNTWSKAGGSASTWVLSANPGTVTSVALFADAGSPGSSPWKYFDAQQNNLNFGLAGFGWPFIRPGSFFLRDDTAGTILCQDSGAFSFNVTGGNCTGPNIDTTHTFVNYFTYDYDVAFTAGHAPAANDVLTAHWTNDISPQQFSPTLTARPLALDYFGNGSPSSGWVSSLFSKVPGGVSGQIYGGEGTDKGWITNANSTLGGYQNGAPGYTAAVSWLYGTKFPSILTGVSSNTKFIATGQWRDAGPSGMLASGAGNSAGDSLYEQWTEDVGTQSTFSATISSNVLTLGASPAVGPMWEGEVIGCVTVATACPIGSQSGVYITGLLSGAWGAASSTYSLAGSPANVSSAAPMSNIVFYQGAGPAFYAGAGIDINDQNSGLNGITGANPHAINGWNGFRRSSARWASSIWGNDASNTTPAADPILDRVKADAVGCDAAALAAPCFDVGTTYSRSYTPTSVSGKVLTFNGLSAHALPIVVGQSVTCSGCSGVLVVSAVSNPPTQSTIAGQGQVGSANNGVTVTLVGSGTLPGGTPAYTFGCSGVSGTGSNCIDVAISVRNSGTFGTAEAIASCGANNLNGTATPNYSTPFGSCSDNGIGEIVRGMRIGTVQNPNVTVGAGDVYDDGIDPTNGAFDQTSAFTCNIVAAKVVQCVRAPSFTSNLPTGVGQWSSSGPTFIAYGDLHGQTGRMGSVMGYVGGQSFPITTAGTGYSNQTVTASCATTSASGAIQPKFDIWTSGGAIVRVVPSASTATPTAPPMGLGIGAAPGATTACTITPTGGSSAVIPAITLVPSEGVGGIATYATDNNMTGVLLYDNSGEPGNPNNGFFGNGQGGYYEPGPTLRPFGSFQAPGVSG